jgi:hypothetical protein
VVSGLMSTFKKIWVDAWSARMEYILTNALLALIEYPDTTLLSVNRLFSDKNYRNQVINYIKDPAVKAFWTEEFASYTDRFAAEALPAIQNKIGQFTGNPLIRNIIGQPKSSFDIRDIMDNKKILIMNLSKGLIGETNANLLGSMLTTRIYLAAMSRADLPVATMKTMPNFYFYVDEFQSFANATFANILSEARKYHLNLIIAHQYIEQMEEEVRDAVFGNVGTTISFRVGPFDAETLETVFTPKFLAADLVNLGFAQIYLTLMIDGIGSQPFSAKTLPPIEPPRISCKNMVIAASRRHFTKPRTEVEKIIDALHAPVAPEKKTTTTKSNNDNNTDKENTSNNSAKDKSAANQDSSVANHVHQNNQKNSSGSTANRTPQNESRRSLDKGGRNVDPSPKKSDVAVRKNSPSSAPSSPSSSPQKPPAQSLGELRAVLAKVAKVEIDNPEPEPLPVTKATPHTPQSTADLRSAIASLGVQAGGDVNNVSTAHTTTPLSTPVSSANVSPTKSRPSTVSDDDVALAKEVEDTFASLESDESSAIKGSLINSPAPNKKDIEYILKGAKGERSPFK